MVYSKRVHTVQESQTAKIAAIAIQMKRDKIDVVDLTVGEPDFPSPQNIRNAAITAINNGKATYTLIAGIVELRKAIQKKLKNDNHLDYEIDNIIVSTGAKQAIFNAILAIVEKDDEVIIPAPYWVSYPEMVSIAEGKSVIIDTDESLEFKLTPQQLADSISEKTKAIILCNPSNPTGAIYSRSELESLAAVLDDKNIVIISDEIYEKLTYDNLEYSGLASLSSNMKSKTLVINGFSKAYAMTGWRIGYAAGEKELIKRMAILQSHSTTNAPTIAQYAAIEALEGSQEELALMHNEFEKRRDFVYNRLQSMEGISCVKPRGAFYVFPNISTYLNTSYKEHEIRTSSDLALYLIKEAQVVLIPGSAFGSDNHLRISFAASMDRLNEGMDRIEHALTNLT